MTSQCQDCGWPGSDERPLYIVSANFGEGAFLAVLCEQCEHRRKYRAELKRRRARSDLLDYLFGPDEQPPGTRSWRALLQPIPSINMLLERL